MWRRDGRPTWVPALDRESLLYAVGVVLGVAATTYFGFRLLDRVSPATTAAVLLAGFGCLLVVGAAVDAETLDLVAYALSAGCYLVFAAYVASRFDPGDAGVFLLLAVSSGLFVGLGRLAQRDRLALSRRRAGAVVAVVLVATVAVVGVDLATGEPTTSATFEERVEIPDAEGSVRVGTVTVENGSPLPREVDPPRYDTCLTGGERSIPLDHEPRPGSKLLGGGESRSYDLLVRGFVFRDDGERREEFAGQESVAVETVADYPGDNGAGLAVVER
ncbi:hypothetical protein BRD05_10285 [Halobacteriales archaeon QS_9_70_65]|nr:MAG: hypothetical protein BRD05_10285 [Halobacteriales archaeon QS_9_70_65]